MKGEPLARLVDDRSRCLARSTARWLIAVTLAMALAGCASLGRNRNQDAIVSAREIALRGTDALQSGRLEQANQLFARAVEVCPVDERVRARYAESLWQQGSRAEAIENMQQAVQLSGGDPELQVRLGRMQLAVGNLQRAAQLADQTIHSGHELAASYRLAGDVLATENRWQEALARYHRALAIHADYPEVQYAIARLYLEHGQVRRALSTLQSLEGHYSKRDSPANLLYLEGLAYKSLGRFDPAIARLTEATKRGLNTADVYYHLADTHYRAGDPTNARLALQQALALQPGHSEATQLAHIIDPSSRIATRPRPQDRHTKW